MVTPRQKAITFGAIMGQGLSSQYRVTNNHPDTWINQELKNLSDNDAFKTFVSEAEERVLGSGDLIEWAAKMSPLALATWFSLNNSSFNGFNAQLLSKLDCKEIINIMQRRWGISLYHNVDMLCPSSEDDAINLWLLMGKHIQLINPSVAPDFTAKYRRNFKRIYLSGGQQHCAVGGSNWRAKVGAKLFKMGFEVENPVFDEGCISDEYGVNLAQLKEENFQRYMEAATKVIKLDYSVVTRCNAMLVYWNESAEKGGGTKSEITWGHDINIPVVTVLASNYSREDLPFWTVGGIRKEEHIVENDNFDKAIQLINRDHGDRNFSDEEVANL